MKKTLLILIVPITSICYNIAANEQGSNLEKNNIFDANKNFEHTQQYQDTIVWSDTIEVRNNIQIHDSALLIIKPGTKVIFQGHYKLEIFGGFLSNGDLENKILFTINDTTGFGNTARFDETGSWDGIYIFGNKKNDSIIINNTIIQYVCTFGSAFKGGGLTIYDCPKIKITNSIFENCLLFSSDFENSGGSGIACYNSKAIINNNVFRDNRSSDDPGTPGISIYSSSSDLLIKENHFYNNSCRNFRDKCSGINVWITKYSNAKIISNQFTNNKNVPVFVTYSSEATISYNIMDNNRGGGISLRSCGNVMINNNIISNNNAFWNGGGINISFTNSNSMIFIYNNLIYNNYIDYYWGHGGGIFIECSDVNVYNNTFYNNRTIVGSGGGIYAYSCSPRIVNNIVYNNKNSDIGYYSGIPYMKSNYTQNPLFINIDSLDFRLSSSSPCINSGTNDEITNMIISDFDGKKRILQEIIDIGAFEGYNPSLSKDPVLNIKISSDPVKIFPNPVNNVLNILSENDKIVAVNIYSIHGTLYSFKNFKSEKAIIIDMNAFPDGIYVIKVIFQNNQVTKKIVRRNIYND